MTDYEPASRYEFDHDRVVGHLDVTSMTGKPGASLTVDGHELTEVKVGRAESRLTVKGTLVRATEGEGTTAVLIVPIVQLERGETGDSHALLLVTRSHGSMVGPAGVHGPLESVRARKVTGHARLVQS